MDTNVVRSLAAYEVHDFLPHERDAMDYTPNITGLATGPAGKKATAVTSISPRAVKVGKRQRELNPERVQELAMSIRQNGQLQPIGVREEKSSRTGAHETTYTLIFGAHRLAALISLGEQGLEQYNSVWASVYPPDYPENQIRMDEITENLHRQDLTPDERAIHTTLYAGWLKKLGLVQEAGKKSGAARSTSGIVADGRPVSPAEPPLPTVTEQVMKTGISRSTVKEHISKR